MITVIYSNFGDDDTKVLQNIWKELDANVIEVTPQTENYKELIDSAIEKETDTIVFCGHGSSNGLLFPDFDRGEYILNEHNVGLIRARKVVCIWCYASDFCIRHNIRGSFSTSMFISNVNEAYDNGIVGYDQSIINEVGRRTWCEVNSLLCGNVPLDRWYERLRARADLENAVDAFNTESLCYIHKDLSADDFKALLDNMSDDEFNAAVDEVVKEGVGENCVSVSEYFDFMNELQTCSMCGHCECNCGIYIGGKRMRNRCRKLGKELDPFDAATYCPDFEPFEK